MQLEIPLQLEAEQDTHFHLFRSRLDKLPWRWEGAGDYYHLKAQRRFKNQADAIADAKKNIKL